MLRRAFFKGVAAAVAGLVGGGWLLGRKKGKPCVLTPAFRKVLDDTLAETPGIQEEFQPVRRCPPNCPECRALAQSTEPLPVGLGYFIHKGKDGQWRPTRACVMS